MKYIISIIVLSTMVVVPVVGFAVAPPSALGNITNPSDAGNAVAYTADSFAEKIVDLVNWFSWIIALVAVVMGLYAGFLFITARGEASQLKTARATLLWAVIGVAVAVLAFSIIAITKSIFTLV